MQSPGENLWGRPSLVSTPRFQKEEMLPTPGGRRKARARLSAGGMGTVGTWALPGTPLRVVPTNYETGESCGCVTYPVAFGGLGGLMPAPGQRPCWRPALPGTGSSGRRHAGLPFPWPRRVLALRHPAQGRDLLTFRASTGHVKKGYRGTLNAALPTREPSQTPPTPTIPPGVACVSP